MATSVELLMLTDDEKEAARKAIRKIAYYKWLDAGCPADSAMDCWLAAEYEWIEYWYVPDRDPASLSAE